MTGEWLLILFFSTTQPVVVIDGFGTQQQCESAKAAAKKDLSDAWTNNLRASCIQRNPKLKE